MMGTGGLRRFLLTSLAIHFGVASAAHPWPQKQRDSQNSNWQGRTLPAWDDSWSEVSVDVVWSPSTDTERLCNSRPAFSLSGSILYCGRATPSANVAAYRAYDLASANTTHGPSVRWEYRFKYNAIETPEMFEWLAVAANAGIVVGVDRSIGGNVGGLVGLSPETGEVLWEKKFTNSFGTGGGGFALALTDDLVYVPEKGDIDAYDGTYNHGTNLLALHATNGSIAFLVENVLPNTGPGGCSSYNARGIAVSSSVAYVKCSMQNDIAVVDALNGTLLLQAEMVSTAAHFLPAVGKGDMVAMGPHWFDRIASAADLASYTVATGRSGGQSMSDQLGDAPLIGEGQLAGIIGRDDVSWRLSPTESFILFENCEGTFHPSGETVLLACVDAPYLRVANVSTGEVILSHTPSTYSPSSVTGGARIVLDWTSGLGYATSKGVEPELGESIFRACADCDAGQHGCAVCQRCPQGMHCDGIAIHPRYCQAGFVYDSGTTGMVSLEACVENAAACPPGRYCPLGVVSAAYAPFCPAGTFASPGHAKTSAGECSNCGDALSFCIEGSSQPVQVSPGHCATGPSQSRRESEVPCGLSVTFKTDVGTVDNPISYTLGEAATVATLTLSNVGDVPLDYALLSVPSWLALEEFGQSSGSVAARGSVEIEIFISESNVGSFADSIVFQWTPTSIIDPLTEISVRTIVLKSEAPPVPPSALNEVVVTAVGLGSAASLFILSSAVLFAFDHKRWKWFSKLVSKYSTTAIGGVLEAANLATDVVACINIARDADEVEDTFLILYAALTTAGFVLLIVTVVVHNRHMKQELVEVGTRLPALKDESVTAITDSSLSTTVTKLVVLSVIVEDLPISILSSYLIVGRQVSGGFFLVSTFVGYFVLGIKTSMVPEWKRMRDQIANHA